MTNTLEHLEKERIHKINYSNLLISSKLYSRKYYQEIYKYRINKELNGGKTLDEAKSNAIWFTIKVYRMTKKLPKSRKIDVDFFKKYIT